MERIRETIQLNPSMQWTETLVVTYPETIDVDVDDDLNRELALYVLPLPCIVMYYNMSFSSYKQALHCAQAAKSLAQKHNLPFTRPSDYFAEMVKSDAHMERIRQRLLDESATIKRAEEKRKEREGKKFGKQVQLEKIKERERSKKEMEERLKGLKRSAYYFRFWLRRRRRRRDGWLAGFSCYHAHTHVLFCCAAPRIERKGALDNAQDDDNDGFDVAVEDALDDRPAKRARGNEKSQRGGDGKKRGLSREARDQKFGFGGPHGRRNKQNTRGSTDDFEPRRGGGGPSRGGRGGGRGGARGGRGGARGGGAKRPGKSRRMSQRGRV